MRIGKAPPRPESPISEHEQKYPTMPRNGLLDGKKGKINRIPLLRTAVLELLYADSPSCIWLRLCNHITNALTITEPYDLVKLGSDVDTFDYCMALIEDRTFARCRILEKQESDDNKTLLKVIFIDHGITEWINLESAAVMPNDFYFHPWQAICVSVCTVLSQRFADQWAEDAPQWSAEECAAFREILAPFPLLKTKTMYGSTFHNDCREPVKVELFGLRSASDSGVSIAALFACETFGEVITRKVPDSSLAHVISSSAQPGDVVEVADFRSQWPEDWKGAKVTEGPVATTTEEWEEWTPEGARVPFLDENWLRENGYMLATEDEFLVCVEGAYTVSPYEWYARPIKRVDCKLDESHDTLLSNYSTDRATQAKLGDDTQSMVEADKELKARAEALDAFYSIPGNRVVLDKEKLCEWLRDGQTVYAIATAKDERAQFTGEFQRVQVMQYQPSASNTAACIRFLDSGGRELEAAETLYKIHPSHCSYPPLCGQFSVLGLADCDPSLENHPTIPWSPESRREWDRLLRVDVPVTITLARMLNLNKERVIGNARTYLDEHVLFPLAIKVSGEESTLGESFKRSQGKGRAREALGRPVPWPEML